LFSRQREVDARATAAGKRHLEEEEEEEEEENPVTFSPRGTEIDLFLQDLFLL